MQIHAPKSFEKFSYKAKIGITWVHRNCPIILSGLWKKIRNFKWGTMHLSCPKNCKTVIVKVWGPPKNLKFLVWGYILFCKTVYSACGHLNFFRLLHLKAGRFAAPQNARMHNIWFKISEQGAMVFWFFNSMAAFKRLFIWDQSTSLHKMAFQHLWVPFTVNSKNVIPDFLSILSL